MCVFIVPGTPKSDSGPGSRFIDTVKKAWSSRVKASQSVDTNLSNSSGHERLSKKSSQPTISESTPSVSVKNAFYCLGASISTNNKIAQLKLF